MHSQRRWRRVLASVDFPFWREVVVPTYDRGDPVGAAQHTAEVLAPGGTVMLVGPFANDRVQDNLSPVARLYYSASTTMCCAHAISEVGHHVLGAQAG